MTKRTFPNEFGNMKREELVAALGVNWRVKVLRLCLLVTRVESFKPYGNGCLNEFHLSTTDQKLSEDIGAKGALVPLVTLAIELGLLKVTDNEVVPGVKGRAFILNPQLAKTVKDLADVVSKEGKQGTLEGLDEVARTPKEEPAEWVEDHPGEREDEPVSKRIEKALEEKEEKKKEPPTREKVNKNLAEELDKLDLRDLMDLSRVLKDGPLPALVTASVITRRVFHTITGKELDMDEVVATAIKSRLLASKLTEDYGIDETTLMSFNNAFSQIVKLMAFNMFDFFYETTNKVEDLVKERISKIKETK